MRMFLSLILVGFCLFSGASAEASGKITLQNNFFDGGKKYRPMIGFGIYEPLFAGTVALNSWTGYGNQPFDLNPDVDWLTTKNQIDFHLSRFTLSPGFQYSFVSPFSDERAWVYVKLDYKLW